MHASFLIEVLAGLSAPHKYLSSEFFYDHAGSLLFEQITQLDEYYPTRTEIGILQTCAPEISARIRAGTVLVEFGSGSSVKTEIILNACPAIHHYVPIDVSPTILEAARLRLATRFSTLRVEPVAGSFAAKLTLPRIVEQQPKLGFFPGSTIGNFTHDRAIALLAGFRQVLGPASRLIVGADLRKAPEILIPAYNDARGVTAAFNLNLLARINRELAGTFDLDGFEHLATYAPEAGRIDMFLVSKRSQTVTVAGQQFQFAAKERIHTEISQKYEIREFQELAHCAGWEAVNVWTDAARLFSVHEFAA